MAYCTEQEVKGYGGTYLNKNVPVTLPINFSLMINAISDEIDSDLAAVGVVMPIDSKYIIVHRRLKHLCILGVLAEVESSIGYASNPVGMGAEPRGRFYRDHFDRLLAKYIENPRLSLFAGEDNIDLAFNINEPIRPKDGALTFYSSDTEVSIPDEHWQI